MSREPRAAAAPMPAVMTFGSVEVRTAERRLLVDGRHVPLGTVAFDLLSMLAAHADRVVTKDELIETVWAGMVVEDNNLQVQISALRKLLGQQAIATVAGRGYRFTLPAQAPAPPPAAERPRAARASVAEAPSARVLVADDNKVNRLLLCRALELVGHHVASVDNGRAALERLRAEPFDLLMLDLEMPEIDGRPHWQGPSLWALT